MFVFLIMFLQAWNVSAATTFVTKAEKSNTKSHAIDFSEDQELPVQESTESSLEGHDEEGGSEILLDNVGTLSNSEFSILPGSYYHSRKFQSALEISYPPPKFGM